MNLVEDERSRGQAVRTLIEALTSLVDAYQYFARPKHIAWANDLIDKVSVGALQDHLADSSYAEQLRDANYSLSLDDAELSLQIRIVNFSSDLLPDGLWIVE